MISLTLPPLRERREDIPLLVNHFIRRYSEQYKNCIEGIDPQALDILIRHPWPGNVRELENCLARAVILSKGPLIRSVDLSDKFEKETRKAPLDPGEKQETFSYPPGTKIKDMERALIQQTLVKCQGNKTEASRLLGISRKALYEKMEKYQING